MSAHPPGPSHRADFSRERRRTALSWVRGEGLLTSGVSADAMVTAVVGLLICDNTGRVTKTALASAMADPSVLQAAESILDEAAAA